MKVLAAAVALGGVALVAGGARDTGPAGYPAETYRSGPVMHVALGGARPVGSPHPVLPADLGSAPLDEIVERYCTRCHSERRLRGNLSLEGFDITRAAENAETAERMIRKLRAGMMPPPGARRPADDTLTALAQFLEDVVDEAAAARPHAGTRPFQRLNRAEYARVVHDLLGLTVDPEDWLPPDRISDGFDNIAEAQTLTATLMDAYLAAASEIARRAIGDRDAATASITYSNPASVSQHEWERAEGAPFGREALDRLLELADAGITDLIALQRTIIDDLVTAPG